MTGPSAITLEGLTKAFIRRRQGDSITVFRDFDWSIERLDGGEIIAVLGASGGGKSTLLNLMSGLVSPDSGRICLLDTLVEGPSGHSVLVPQTYTCLPWLTARQNVEFGLSLQGPRIEGSREYALTYLGKVGLAKNANSYPNELSGGMQQRVALARALAVKRPIILMDEPFGALDSVTRSQMQLLLLDLWEQEKNLIVFVTHDITEALLLADRVVVLPAMPITRITDVVDVPFGRPRRPSLVYTPEFREITQVIKGLFEHSTGKGTEDV